MEYSYTVGMKLKWTPLYFKWDTPAEVTVTHVYRDGSALLSNQKMVDREGLNEWHRKLGGRVDPLPADKGAS
jgi:hypothetical protein